jgi:hypothetical protein
MLARMLVISGCDECFLFAACQAHTHDEIGVMLGNIAQLCRMYANFSGDSLTMLAMGFKALPARSPANQHSERSWLCMHLDSNT